MGFTTNSFEKENQNAINLNQMQKKAIVIAGPTASGKSGLGLELAEKINGVIVNADSMQVYKDVPTLTARPTVADEQRIAHRLYGFLDPNQNFNAFEWVKKVKAEVQKIQTENKIPVFVGGTGFYLQTLINGISPMPEVSEEIRNNVRYEFEKIGETEFLKKLKQRDETFALTDPQRAMRALEVLEQTGKSITYWQSLPLEKQTDLEFFTCFLNPERKKLYEQCNDRFEKMMQENVIEEVEALFEKNPNSDSLILKAIGVREIKDMLDGKMTKTQAIEKAQQLTRNYAKRQVTWFKHRFDADIILENSKNDDLLTKALHFLG